MSETQTTELMQDSALFDDVAKQALCFVKPQFH